jgi:hypothetical protein
VGYAAATIRALVHEGAAEELTMSTTSMDATRRALIGTRTGTGEWFFVWMALAALGICLVGFFPTYVMPVATATFSRPPLVHLHGVTMFAWMALFAGQTWLAATGRLGRHRSWGMLGIALTTAAVLLLVATLAMDANYAEAVVGPAAGVRSRADALGFMAHGVLFGALVGAGVASVRRPDVHKRLMLLANVVALAPALGRIVRIDVLGVVDFFAMTPRQGIIMGIGILVASEALVAAGLWHDWRTRGRPHVVYLLGALVMLPGLMLLQPLGTANGWQGAMWWLQHLGG